MGTYTNKINKSNLIAIVAHKTGLETDMAGKVIDCFLSSIVTELSRGHAINLSGFGSFENKLHKKKKVNSHLTGMNMVVDERFIPKYTPSKAVKERVNQKFSLLKENA